MGLSTKSRVQQYFAQIYHKTKELFYGTAAAVTALKQSLYDRRTMDTMDESSEVKPVLIWVVSADGLGGLKKVFDLGLIKVWIALVDELIEKLHAFPYAHLPLLQLPILFLLPLGLCAPINHSNVTINLKCFDKEESWRATSKEYDRSSESLTHRLRSKYVNRIQWMFCCQSSVCDQRVHVMSLKIRRPIYIQFNKDYVFDELGSHRYTK